MKVSAPLAALFGAWALGVNGALSNGTDTTVPNGTESGTVGILPPGGPHPPPPYMKNNINNQEGTAPDKGVLKGPVMTDLDASLANDIHKNAPKQEQNSTQIPKRSRFSASPAPLPLDILEKRQGGGYWLAELGSKGQSPFAPSGYQFYRNVKDFGAKGDGVTDDTAAINRAAAAMSADNMKKRCGDGECGSTTTLGALVYFPEGTYVISSPIIQYYLTQFVGNPNNKPVIKGSTNFSGIALVDNNFYIPGGNGHQWYINQSNFLRQIRNFVFDMRSMNWTNWQGDQEYVPAGIHWQVGQATSITNCDFKMAVSTDKQRATGVGIFMENGSGGVVADLTFEGGNIGFFAGSQQFTATNLKFTSCLTAIKQQWNWGFTWKNIKVHSCWIAIDCTEYSKVTTQGTGSITVLDSHFSGVPTAITIAQLGDEQPNIVLDNLLVENSQSVITITGKGSILDGSSGQLFFESWASGIQYLPDGSAGKRSGFMDPAPKKPEGLLDASGKYFVRSKPQYEGVAAGSIVVATDHGVKNDGTGDQTAAINSLLSGNVGSLIYFPGGIYLVEGTVKIPVGSTIVGSLWSQIMGTGKYFQDASDPKVMVQVGNDGDSGKVEISDMMFTVKGPTAGCILLEWNVHESSQGSAAMWDTHFRVGGATGTDLLLKDCPTGASSVDPKCMAAYMLMHVPSKASGYFDNIWLWVSDHDLDDISNKDAYESPEGIPLNVKTQISIYAGRGLLVESQGPTWFYGSSSEHCQMYQYQLHGAKDIFLSHMQTETPYYQPNPNALEPYEASDKYPGDPTFSDCDDDSCKSAWALRIINSTDVVIYSAGFYSFFKNNQLGCTANEDCQTAMIVTSYSQGIWIYNIFTKGNIQIVTRKGAGMLPVLFNDTTRNGYTSEIAAWLVLALGGGDKGIEPNSTRGGGSGDIYIDPGIWRSSSPTISCTPPCTYILPPTTLPSQTTISFPPFTTELEVGSSTVTTYTGVDFSTTTTDVFVVVTVMTTLSIPALTTNIIPVSNVPIVSGINSTVICPTWSLYPAPLVITNDGHPEETRTVTPPPFPWAEWPSVTSVVGATGTPSCAMVMMTHTRGPPGPICKGGCGRKCNELFEMCEWPCPFGCDDPDPKSCVGDSCTEGADCSGPECKHGGDCEGPNCTKGGDCTGPKCESGGDCKGPKCKSGGKCWGLHCLHGGGCIGPLCLHGGGCGPFGCPKGFCIGPVCGHRDPNFNDQSFCDPKNPNCFPPGGSPGGPAGACTPTTTSKCRTLCTKESTCTSTCSPVVGCKPTGTQIGSLVSPAPTLRPEVEDWKGWKDTNGLLGIAQQVINHYLDGGALPPSNGEPNPGNPGGNPGNPGGNPGGNEPTKYLDIVFTQYAPLDAPFPVNNWEFWAAEMGKGYDPCKDKPLLKESADRNIGDPRRVPPPKGTWHWKSETPLVGGCSYQALENEPGRMYCGPEPAREYQCAAHNPEPKTCPGAATFVDIVWKVRCHFG